MGTQAIRRLTAPLLTLCCLAGTALPQASLAGGKQGFAWTGDCSMPVTFQNDTGVDLCDLWIEVGNDGVNNATELSSIELVNAGGLKKWRADDNEDSDDDDGAAESDAVDATSGGNTKGLHRVQAHLDSDCIPAGATFSLTLCGEGGVSLLDQPIYLWPTAHSTVAGKTGGDDGRRIAPKPKELGALTPSGSSALVAADLYGGSALDFVLAAQNGDPSAPLLRVRLERKQTDVDFLYAASPAGVWDAAAQTLWFQPPLQPGASAPIYFGLTNLSQSSPTTDIELAALGFPAQTYCTAKQSPLGCLPAIGSLGQPSASTLQPFRVTCANVSAAMNGLMFYGYGAAAQPFQGGFLCVAPPLTRTQVQNSGGAAGTCNGHFDFDFKAWLLAGADPLLTPGREVFCEYWFRDPPAQGGSGFSNGLLFVIDV